jgi:hypothetical protein
MKLFKNLFTITFFCLSVASLQAQEPSDKDLYKLDAVPRDMGSFHENRVEVGIETGQLFDVGGGTPRYHIAPQILTVHWQLDDIGNEGWRRGNTEFIFSGYFTPVIKGIEDRYIGALWGPRYNFVQEGWDIVPYLGARVGIGFNDSRSNQQQKGQGQDFVFTFMVEVGAKYIINDQLNVGLGVMYQHFSNAGLSEPQRINYGLDTLGPVLSLNYGF